MEANNCPFISIAPGILSRVKKEQEQAFGGYSSVVSLKTPPKNNRTVTWIVGAGFITVTVVNLEYTRSRGQSRVYTFDIHRKSPRPEEDYVEIEYLFIKGLYKTI